MYFYRNIIDEDSTLKKFCKPVVNEGKLQEKGVRAPKFLVDSGYQMKAMVKGGVHEPKFLVNAGRRIKVMFKAIFALVITTENRRNEEHLRAQVEEKYVALCDVSQDG